MRKIVISKIEQPLDARAIDALSDVLISCVNSGASVGFFAPLAYAEAHHFWQRTLESVLAGERLMLIARCGDRIVGSVQLQGVRWPNGRHRADVMKLLVHADFRRRGIARALLAALEREARDDGRELLVLDTRSGDGGEQLYRALGWQLAGSIPGYVRTPHGQPEATSVYYKPLPATAV